MAFIRIICVLSAMMLFSSCALFSPAKPHQTTYVLNSVPSYVPTKRIRHIDLLVNMPEADSAYDSKLMAYTTKPYGIAYYSRNSWAETPPHMLQPLIVQTLEKTHHFHTIVTSAMGRYDYMLNTHLIKLQQNFLYCPVTYELVLQVELIRATTNKIVAAKRISVTEIVPQATPYGGVIAANRATAKALQQIATFVLHRT